MTDKETETFNNARLGAHMYIEYPTHLKVKENKQSCMLWLDEMVLYGLGYVMPFDDNGAIFRKG